ncbi:MAG: esterase/lipase family protein [Planctomycetales bacterium]
MIDRCFSRNPPRRRALFHWGAGLVWGAWLLAVAPRAPGSEPAATTDESIADDEDSDVPNRKRSLLAKTLGGRQFWADVEFFHSWRIQQHVQTRHYRLLDGDDYRHVSGTRAECHQALQQIRTERKLPPMSGEAVILIHGLVRSSKSMGKLQQRLDLEEEGMQTFSFGYPSTQIDIPRAAEYLHSAIESLEGIERIHFVVHSMGGLVVRAYLAEHSDPRIGRLVMIATPNQGADLADRFQKVGWFRALAGPAGQQLTRGADGFIAGLPTPAIEFGVIAGGRGNNRGYNPLIPGDDDGTVSVECTRLEGARDFVVLDHLHTFLITAPQTREYTVRFLKEGRFRDDAEPTPIVSNDELELE